MSTYRSGRHEHGQNFLHDRSTRHAIVESVRSTSGPIIEIGPGAGALTEPLVRLGRPLTAVEIDPRLAARLLELLGDRVEVVVGDFLRYRLPKRPHVLVANLPFHQTTAMLRHIFRSPGWTHAVLLMQWEVARRRAGVGGSTLMTAQYAPWFTFELVRRVPARAFTPAPTVDGGLLTVTRRTEPLLPHSARKAFQSMAYAIFTSSGRGIAQITTRAGLFVETGEAIDWARAAGVRPQALPKDLTVEQWVNLFQASGTSPPGGGRSLSRLPRNH